ncbi:uncharacterized protein BDZ99DRAFT_514383 [Mytilinidion resinicola]|uniref:Uncharacterized protein n=1 Tax=Mytilinidion resinicola TaxID=574789 RepID=A0A6A6Z3X9_9PEZI|nr:uncharacterized protein BDZ99DRAFT_514383 [Mytilinidion resinicola]KAF2815740.1 hypothetical protein BDZ99DRAFT_514383 [Mytilinidion resinicola]
MAGLDVGYGQPTTAYMQELEEDQSRRAERGPAFKGRAMLSKATPYRCTTPSPPDSCRQPQHQRYHHRRGPRAVVSWILPDLRPCTRPGMPGNHSRRGAIGYAMSIAAPSSDSLAPSTHPVTALTQGSCLDAPRHRSDGYQALRRRSSLGLLLLLLNWPRTASAPVRTAQQMDPPKTRRRAS